MNQNRNDPAPRELLAAYAAGGLDGPEADGVEDLLEREPGARQELESLRETIAHVRAAQPTPEEPDWHAMTQDILAECSASSSRSRPPLQDLCRSHLGGLVQRLLRPPSVLAGATVAITVLLAIWWWPADRPPPTRPVGSVAIAPEHDEPAIDLRAAELDDLDESELEVLLDELTPKAFDQGPLHNETTLLPQEMATEWTGHEQMDETLYGTAFEIGFAEPNYESWLDGVEGAEIEALLSYLETEAG